MSAIRIGLIAPDPLARAALAALLADEIEVLIVAQAGDETALADAFDAPPDAILWDLGWDPPEEMPELGSGGAPVLVLLATDDDVAAARSAGAAGLLHRGSDVAQVVAGLRAIAAGLVAFSPAFAASGTLSDAPPLDAGAYEALTPREMEVLQLLALGVTNRAIGNELQISEYTVKFHVNAIMGKLEAQSRTEAVVRATRLGLIVL